ncbi:MAG TPA: ABC transporter permease [Anaerolineales bacterium]|nr:ABC transporter permease [Anaerolineales bacterium]
MGVLWKKILRDLWLNRLRTLLIVVVVVSGTAAFGMLLASRVVTERTEREQYLGTSPAHAILTIPEFGDALIRRVERVAGVARAEGGRVMQARLQTASGQWIPLEISSVADFEDWQINRVYPENGVVATPAQGAILLERTVLSAGPIGTTVIVQSVRGITESLEVAGFVNDPSVVQYPLTQSAFGYVSSGTMEALDRSARHNRLYVLTEARQRDSIERILTAVQDTVEAEGYQLLRAEIPTPGRSLRADPLSAILFVLSQIGLLTLCLAGLLVGNVMASVMGSEVRQIGILKSLGAGTGRIAGLYARQAAIYGLIAIVVAVPLAHFLGAQLSGVIAERTNFRLPRFWLPSGVLTLQLAAGLGLPLAAASLPVLNGSRKTALRALAEIPPIHWKAGPIGQALARVAGMPGLARMAIRNAFRRTGRMLLTLGMLTLAGAMFVAVLGARRSLQADLAKIQATVSYDVSLTMVEPLSQKTLLSRVQRIPGIVAVEAWLQSEARIVLADRITGGVPVLGVPSDSTMTRPNIIQGRWFVPDDDFAVFLSSNVLELVPGLKAGDVVVLKIADEEMDWTVIGLEDRQLRPTAIVPLETLERVTGLAGQAQMVVVRTVNSSPSFQETIEADLREAFRGSSIAGTHTTAEERQSQAAQLDLLLWLLMMVVLLVLVDGGLGLAVTMGLNVMERTREMGVLRALGAQDGSIRGLVISEGLFIGLVSWMLGAAGAVPFGVWLTGVLGTILYGRPVEYIFSVPATLLWLSIVLAIVTVASLLPAQRALDVPVREALGYLG